MANVTFRMIPNEIIIKILKYLPLVDLIDVGKTSKLLYNLAYCNAIWKDINEELIGESINIESWMEKLEIESQYEFYEKVVRYAVMFNGTQVGDVYPQGHILKWELDYERPEAVGYFAHLSNGFRASDRFRRSLEDVGQGYMITVDGRLLYRLDEVIEAGLALRESKFEDLSVTFTPSDPSSPVKAFDIESGEAKPCPISFNRVNVKEINENKEFDKHTFPSKDLLPFVDKSDDNFIDVITFDRPYPWPEEEPLRTFKLKEFENNNDSLEGIFAGTFGGHGIELLGANLLIENG